jgi:hypothetical protein
MGGGKPVMAGIKKVGEHAPEVEVDKARFQVQ